MVSITLRVLSKPDPFKLPFIYRRLGKGESTQGVKEKRRRMDVVKDHASYRWVTCLMSGPTV